MRSFSLLKREILIDNGLGARMARTSPHPLISRAGMAGSESGPLRLCRVLFVERRLPIRCWKLYYRFMNSLGIHMMTVRSPNGLTIRGYTNSLFTFHETWSKREYDVPGLRLGGGMTVVDVGASQGFFSLYAASQGATVHAFEPCAESFEILKWNIAKNGLESRVKPFNVAVTGKKGMVTLFVGFDDKGEIMLATVSTVNISAGGEKVLTRQVESVTLDSLLDDLHIVQCDLLKVDCEGAEYEILRHTSTQTFEKIAHIAMECHENRMQEADTILRNAGFATTCEDTGWLGILKARNPRLQ